MDNISVCQKLAGWWESTSICRHLCPISWPIVTNECVFTCWHWGIIRSVVSCFLELQPWISFFLRWYTQKSKWSCTHYAPCSRPLARIHFLCFNWWSRCGDNTKLPCDALAPWTNLIFSDIWAPVPLLQRLRAHKRFLIPTGALVRTRLDQWNPRTREVRISLVRAQKS